MTVFVIVSILLIVITVLATLDLVVWWVKVFNAIRIHLAVLMGLTIITGFIFFGLSNTIVNFLMAALAAGAVFNFIKIREFTPLHPVEIETAGSNSGIQFLAANVRKRNKDYKKFVNLIEKAKPDVFLITEPDQDWIDGIKSLEKAYPHTVLQPQDNTYGLALYSRLPMQDKKISFLVKDNVPSFQVKFQLPNDTIIQYIGLHPKPPAPWTKAKYKDLELIVAAEISNYTRYPTIVSGDLNDVGWSRATRQFKSISGMLDPRIGRGLFNTYNALIPLFRVPIDHFFISKHFKLVKMVRLEKFGSDHFPVLIEVSLDEQRDFR